MRLTEPNRHPRSSPRWMSIWHPHLTGRRLFDSNFLRSRKAAGRFGAPILLARGEPFGPVFYLDIGVVSANDIPTSVINGGPTTPRRAPHQETRQ